MHDFQGKLENARIPKKSGEHPQKMHGDSLENLGRATEN